jgi:hypothetical protein
MIQKIYRQSAGLQFNAKTPGLNTKAAKSLPFAIPLRLCVKPFAPYFYIADNPQNLKNEPDNTNSKAL